MITLRGAGDGGTAGSLWKACKLHGAEPASETVRRLGDGMSCVAGECPPRSASSRQSPRLPESIHRGAVPGCGRLGCEILSETGGRRHLRPGHA